MLKSYSWNSIEYLKIHGRTTYNNAVLPLFVNGSAVEVNVSGSELWIEVDVDYEIYEPWVYIEINGCFMARQMLAKGSYELCLFRGMDPEVTKNVRFIRELQPMRSDDVSHLYVKGFKTDGAFSKVPDYKYKLEFIGDSITSGEGTYGAVPDTDWIPMYMSNSHTYTRFLADMMNAEIRNISNGGYGVASGYDNNPESVIPLYYEQVCGICKGEQNISLGAHNEYDFTSWIPDAIIVNLGTNDGSSFNNPPFSFEGKTYKHRRNADGSLNRDDVKEVQLAIVNFLKCVRKNNPSSAIIWCYGMLPQDFTKYIPQAVKMYIKETSDNNISLTKLPAVNDRTVGSRCGHPGLLAHQQAANIISRELKRILHIQE